MNWEQKIYNHEVQPPEQAWENILQSLNNDSSSLRNKMLTATAEPPVEAWDRIRNALYGAEQKIPTPVRSIFSRPVFRVAAAAAVLGFITWTGYQLFFRSGSKPAFEPATLSGDASGSGPSASTSAQNPAMLNLQTPLRAGALAMAGFATRPGKKPAGSSNPLASTASYDENQKHWDYQSQENEPMVGDIDVTKASFPIDLAGLQRQGNEDYFTITGPNGEPLQISSKFRDVIHMLNPDSSDEEIAEKLFSGDESWREKFNAWKEKLSRSAYSPETGNFLDIGELIRLLNDEKKTFYSRYPLF